MKIYICSCLFVFRWGIFFLLVLLVQTNILREQVSCTPSLKKHITNMQSVILMEICKPLHLMMLFGFCFTKNQVNRSHCISLRMLDSLIKEYLHKSRIQVNLFSIFCIR